jgi:hypothetical protein
VAARAHKHEYEVFEEAFRRHLGLQEVVEQVWSSLGPDAASEEESMRRARGRNSRRCTRRRRAAEPAEWIRSGLSSTLACGSGAGRLTGGDDPLAMDLNPPAMTPRALLDRFRLRL